MSLRIRRNKVPTPPICPLTECMALLRGAWASHIIWYLSAQPRRFGELRVDMPKISARVLSARLHELEARGVVSRRVMPTSPPSVEYALTELGRELVPAIQAIVRVGLKLRGPAHEPPHQRSAARRGASGEPTPAMSLDA